LTCIEAEKELLAAQTNTEVAAAEEKLALATTKQQSLLEPPALKQVQINPASLRIGLITETELRNLIVKDSNLAVLKS
jgi:hypothetical protein